MIFIYILIDPEDLSIRYVGKTNDLHRRYNEHLNDKGDTYKCRWIKKLKSSGLVPEIKKIKEVSECEDWQFWEQYFIDSYLEKGCRLVNTGNAGAGGSLPGRKLPDNFGEKISKALSGRKLSLNHIEKISKGLSGRILSEIHCEKIGNLHRGKIVSKDTKEKISKSSIGNRSSDYVKPAMAKFKNIPLSKEIKLKISEKSKKQSRIKRKIKQFTLSGMFVKEWPSCNSARLIFGDSILLACQLKIKTAFGFQWRYSNEVTTYNISSVISSEKLSLYFRLLNQ